MNTQVAGKSKLFRRAARAAWVAPVAAAGFAFGLQAPGAAGDITVPSLPIPTVSVPALSVPQILPTTSTTATDPASGGTSTVTTAAAGVSTTAAPTPTAISGARRLANGAISIPISSVRAPERLVVSVSLAPRTVSRRAQTVRARVKVADTRGYLVRGARVSLRAIPAGSLGALARQISSADGQAGFTMRLRDATLRRGSLLLIVSAADPAAPKLAAASRSVRLPIRILPSR
jgi:hypothetical protein